LNNKHAQAMNSKHIQLQAEHRHHLLVPVHCNQCRLVLEEQRKQQAADSLHQGTDTMPWGPDHQANHGQLARLITARMDIFKHDNSSASSWMGVLAG
jgi:tryptophanyl-tRNA synthetase